MIFAVKDSNNQQQIPMSLNSGGVQISVGKAIAFGDDTLQTSAYTGAKSLAGSYTYSNITIDTQGKITAISSNSATSVPSTITSAITFTGGATFSDSTTTFNSAINAYSTLDVVGKLSFNSFDSINIMRTVDMGPGSSGTNYQNIQQSLSLDSTSYGIYNNNIQDYDVDVIYYVIHPDYLTAGVINIPANTSQRIQFNIPLRLTHNWCFQGDQESTFYEYKTFFYYYVEKIEILLTDTSSNETAYSFYYENSSRHSSTDLGYFYVEYDRKAGTSGPSDDKHVMTQEFLISNPMLQFIPNKQTTPKSYYVKARYVWSYRYTHIGGQSMNARNHWGNPDPSHYFEPWNVTINPTSGVIFETYALNYNNNPPSYTEKYEELWKNKMWKRPFYANSNYFSWGTYYSTLPWGTMTGFNNEKISTNTKLLCGVGHFDSLWLNGNLQSTGLIHSRGYMGRPGLGSDSSNGNFSYPDMFQNQSVVSNNWFNHFWTGEKIETWVDFSKLLSQSPNVSDYRIKSNFKQIKTVLNDICKTSISQFDIDYDLYHVTSKTGVVAHELQENFSSFPHLVIGTKDAVDQEGKIVPQSVDFQELTIILMKGIQELKIENDQLKEQTSQLHLQVQELYSMIQSLLTPPPN
jgi:hypothetical protein